MSLWYFAHPISDYGTGCEIALINRLMSIGLNIENPNHEIHQEGYAQRGMDYFLEDVLPNCNGCVFMPFRGGLIGSGVAMEVEYFLERDQKVFELLSDSGVVALFACQSLDEKRILTRDETRAITKLFRTLPNGGRSYA